MVNHVPAFLRPKKMKPLEYMLSVMNDPGVDPIRRDRMAIAAAPYVHARAEELGKKDQRLKNAQEIGMQRFTTPPTPPRLVANA